MFSMAMERCLLSASQASLPRAFPINVDSLKGRWPRRKQAAFMRRSIQAPPPRASPGEDLELYTVFFRRDDELGSRGGFLIHYHLKVGGGVAVVVGVEERVHGRYTQ